MTGTRSPAAREQDPARESRSKRHHRIGLAAATLVAAAAVATGISAALPSASPAPSPLSTLTSALMRTSAHSYAFGIDTTVRAMGKEQRSDLVSGAYDPSQHLGTEQLTARGARQTSQAQVRFIGANLYTSVSPSSGFGKPWDESPLAAATADGLQPGSPYSFASDQVVSPSGLIAVLNSVGTAVRDSGSASGPGWTGNEYTFTATPYAQTTMSGTVCIDQQGRVRLMRITTEEYSRVTGRSVTTTDRQITFGDFGAPVRVTAPPASQVQKTSGRPYWGFYF
jgi:hypothetical protein